MGGQHKDFDEMERAERLASLAELPKVELHRHLEGALRPKTLLELGRKRRLNLPLADVASLLPQVTWSAGEPRSLAYFLTKFRADWYASYADVERVATEAVEDAAAEGVVHLELRFSPEHFARHSGLRPDGVMRAVVEAGQAAAQQRDLGLRFLITFARERLDERAWRRIVDQAAEMSELGVVGVDLAGNEFDHPNAGFCSIMTRAKDTGVLGVTIHAGEGTGPESVRSAVEQLHADRIGHGISAADSQQVMALLAERGIVLEVCPISNYQTGCVDDLADHPLPALRSAGVPVTLNSDDPTIHRASLIENYEVAVVRWGFDLDDLLQLEQQAARAAFLPPEAIAALLERIQRGFGRFEGRSLS